MKRTLVALVLPLAVLGACGGEDDGKDAGARACKLYQVKMQASPEAIAETSTLSTIKGFLSDIDDTTRRAFADLISAADANPYLAGVDRYATDKAAAEVRSACLSEHSVDVPN